MPVVRHEPDYQGIEGRRIARRRMPLNMNIKDKKLSKE